MSLANHAYWNLSGDFASGAAGVLDHQLQLHAHRVLGVDGTQIPTGELLAVDETAFDFSASRRIGDRCGCRAAAAGEAAAARGMTAVTAAGCSRSTAGAAPGTTTATSWMQVLATRRRGRGRRSCAR